MFKTLFQAIKQCRYDDGIEFNLPIGPAFFTKAEAQEWLDMSGLSSEGYEVQAVGPMAL